MKSLVITFITVIALILLKKSLQINQLNDMIERKTQIQEQILHVNIQIV